MASQVKLRLGDLFDGPADLIVLPCSTSGTVTGFVAQRLANYDIPRPRRGMQLGEVDFLPFDGAENIAQFVAFAASVRHQSSAQEAICEIGRTVGRFTMEEPMVRAVSAPLLGAGAGHLEAEDVVAGLRLGFDESAASDACLTISVLKAETYDRLRTRRSRTARRGHCPARVFISHTSRTADEVEWVKDLAFFLIGKGLQVRLDRLHLRRGMDLPQWMCNELALADRVLIVSNKAYKAKADGRSGGVGWETMIIQGDIAGLLPESTKYQVIVREENLDDGLPMYLRNRYAFHSRPSDSSPAFREELVNELLGLPLDARLESAEFYL